MLADNQQNSLPATSTGGCQETVHNRYSGYLELDSTYNSYTETIVWASAGGGYDKVTMSYKAKNE